MSNFTKYDTLKTRDEATFLCAMQYTSQHGGLWFRFGSMTGLVAMEPTTMRDLAVQLMGLADTLDAHTSTPVNTESK